MHPITVFVVLQIISVIVLVIWVIWFIRRQEEITKIANNFGRQYLESGTVIGALVAGCILLGVILLGTVVLFVSGQQKAAAIQQQQRFISSVTHELRSPLSSLQLAFETIQARTLDESTRQKLMGMALGDIGRLARLVDQILISARLDRGILLSQEDAIELDPADAIREICEAAAYLDQKIMGRITIVVPTGYRLHASKQALSMLLGNLIENSVKYSPLGTPIVVKLAINDDSIEFSVKDQGFGLDKKEIKKVFKMFHRAEGAIKRAISGTGLGLFIVKTSVKVFGGKVWAESPGHGLGSTFIVKLPYSDKIRPIRDSAIATTADLA